MGTLSPAGMALARGFGSLDFGWREGRGFLLDCCGEGPRPSPWPCVPAEEESLKQAASGLTVSWGPSECQCFPGFFCP